MRKRFVVPLLLLAALAVPQLLWLGGHAVAHSENAENAEHAEWTEVAKVLVHGHEHEEGVPEHEHHLLPSPLLRPDAPRDFQAPAAAAASLGVMDAGHLLLSGTRLWEERTRLSGASPPRLHLLCTLLI